MIGKAREAMATQQLHQVLNAVWAVVAEANRYFAGEAPWALAKTDPQRQGTVLYVTAEVLRQVAILALPFMPDVGGKAARPSGGAGRTSASSRISAARSGSPRDANSPRRRRYFRAMSSRRRARRNKHRTMLIDSHCHLDFPGFCRRA